jgi:hypothetical protein
MMQGLNCFCYNLDEGNQVLYDFSCAVSTIAELIQANAEGIAKKLGKVMEEVSH